MAKTLKVTVVMQGPDGEVHTFGPGDDVPEWAAEKCGDHCWDAGDEDQADEGYGGMTVSELKDAIDKRNADKPDDEHISKAGNKAELVAALEADDAA